MNAKKVLAYLALTALLVAVADLGSTWALSGRRNAMRQLAGELRRGMTRAEVEEVISRQPTKMFSRTPNGDGIRLSTAVDWVHTWTVSMVFDTIGWPR